ncbi:hypothetical protein [Vibrio marisflavi]|uniref:Stability/partitioning determinant n=1 Tax=Vibrio marisflavi CECT 7928 TaxID=634439 RepID=A0ABM9AA61_9VIBR|nr:hypothetical protein [Vibrio marisflavi]CAH0543118.1 hypothetical protein VMF7928_04409 [Vibrio marisflavi CECT 7928]
MIDQRFDWMKEEDERASRSLMEGQLPNPKAPRLVKTNKAVQAPKRTTRGVFVRDSIWADFEDVIHYQKKIKGLGKPELVEEALLYAINKYKK